jgi:hypothetical protein
VLAFKDSPAGFTDMVNHGVFVVADVNVIGSRIK